MTPIRAISVGVEAPDFELPSSELAANNKPGKKIRLSDYRGDRHVLIAFFPLAFSPVCTQEVRCLQEDVEKLAATRPVQVLGFSVDSAWTLAAFKGELGLSYPFVSDFHPKGEVARKYGLYLEEMGITARATVIVDKAGKVEWVKVQQIPDPRDMKEICAFLDRLS